MNKEYKTTEAQRKATKKWTEEHKERKKELDRQHHKRRSERIKREHQALLDIKEMIDNPRRSKGIYFDDGDVLIVVENIVNKALGWSDVK